MIALLSAVGSLLSFRVRSRATLELELVALRHQLTVLRRQRPGRPRLFSTDRLLWVWLYQLWPQVLDPWCWSNRPPSSSGIEKASASTGGGGRATWDGPG